MGNAVDSNSTSKDPQPDVGQFAESQSQRRSPDTPRKRYEQGTFYRDFPDTQSFESLKRKCLLNGTLYIDSNFPASNCSIYGSAASSRKIEWKRPPELVAEPKFVGDRVNRTQIIQGNLNDCWLMAAMASLARYRSLLKRVVPLEQSFQRDYAGIFNFRIWSFGRWIDVVVDDRLPTIDGRLFFMHSGSANEFWCALLEKAFAKLYGSYMALECGNIAAALEDFTGGLCEVIELAQYRDSTAELAYFFSRCHLMGCYIDSDVVRKLANGLVMGHAYTVMGVRQVRLKSQNSVTLVRVRNPWGASEWRGAWSDFSEAWNLVSDSDKQLLGWRQGGNGDGEFWMSLQDFSREFSQVTICHLGSEVSWNDNFEGMRNFSWSVSTHYGSWHRDLNAGGCETSPTFWTNPQFAFTITETDSYEFNTGTVIIGLMQRDKERGENPSKNPYIGYVIYEFNKLFEDDRSCMNREFLETEEPLATSTYRNDREAVGRHELRVGRYVVVATTYDAGEENDFLLRVFSKCK